MKVAVLYSGGKDSTYALHWAWLQGFRIKVLVSIEPRRNSYMFHYPGISAVQYQAKALNLPLIYIRSMEKEPEKELLVLKKALLKAIEEYNVDGIVVGALLSDYQRMRIALVAEELGLKTYTPLWRINQKNYLLEIVDFGIKFVITRISVYGLPKNFLGKIIEYTDALKIIRLAEKYKFNPAFEGGEAETLVLDAPLFKEKLCIKGYIVEEAPYTCQLVLTSISLCKEPKIRLIKPST